MARRARCATARPSSSLGATRTPQARSEKLNSLQAGPDPANPAFIEYSQILTSLPTLRQHLTAASPAFAGLIGLDRYLASVGNTPPSIAALQQQVTALLGAYLNTNEWRLLRAILSEIFYGALLISAYTVNLILIEAQGLLARWLLVMALVDTLEEVNSPIQTPDDVYNALRWRTLVLPDVISLLLLAIRASRAPALVRKPGFADLYITREEWDHYEPAEIASIENILARELKSRVHVLVNQTTVTTTTEQITTTTKEQDTTTTDLTQLQQQSTSDISLAAHIDGQVDTSGQYGPTQVNTHLGGSLDYSTSTSTSKATTQSHETVSRAINKIEQTTRQVRTVSTLTRATDKEIHKFDNTQGDQPTVGIYRWVDQIQNVELDRYPHRLLMEFEIPEPGAWTRWAHLDDVARATINQPPAPLTIDGNPITAANPLLKATDINAGTYSALAARYLAAGISPPPGDRTVAVNIGYPASADTAEAQVPWRYQSDTTLSVPNGYYAVTWVASFQYSNMALKGFDQGLLDIAVGGGDVKESNPVPPPEPDHITGQFGLPPPAPRCPVGPISIGEIPIAIQARNVNGFQINVEVLCTPLDQTIAQWQSDTYALIVGNYNALLQAYNDERAGLTVQQTNLADANLPAQNAETIKQELKRQVIEMLIGQRFRGRNAITLDPNDQEPTTDLVKAANFAPEIQFLEQAFEWETLSYICYPYYWADSQRWWVLARIEGNDPDFADFLRAGSARVVLAARPGFEDQVNLYTLYGLLWGGGPMPAPNDEAYLSIAGEIKAQQQRPLDVTVIDTWQVRLPTTLIWLENPDGLPARLS
jgi:hypothetical protein